MDVDHDEGGQRFITPDRVFTLGDAVEVRLRDADVATGSLVFELLSGASRHRRQKANAEPASAAANG